MPDLHSLLPLPAYLYGAAAAGLAAALAVRASSALRGLSPADAAWCAALPALAVVLVPVVALLEPHAAAPPAAVHDGWHDLARQVHLSSAGHGALHVTNALLALLVLACAGRTAHSLARMRAFAVSVRAAAQPTGETIDGTPLLRLPSEKPLCFTLGVFRPCIYATAGLLERITPRDREAILAHEAAHVRRRDGLAGALLTAFYALFPLPGSRLLLRGWRAAAERACDAEAARRIGSPLDVAAALVRVARSAAGPPAPVPGAPCFADGSEDLESRVQALLSADGAAAPRPGRRALPSGPAVGISAGVLFAAGFWVHHLVELFVRH